MIAIHSATTHASPGRNSERQSLKSRGNVLERTLATARKPAPPVQESRRSNRNAQPKSHTVRPAPSLRSRPANHNWLRCRPPCIPTAQRARSVEKLIGISRLTTGQNSYQDQSPKINGRQSEVKSIPNHVRNASPRPIVPKLCPLPAISPWG